MSAKVRVLLFATLSLLLVSAVTARAKEPAVIPAGSKVYIAPMDGFETHLKAAIEKKKVPLTVVDSKEGADYVITGVASSQKASTAKKIIFGSWHSREEASIQVSDLKAGVIVFAYSYNTSDSAHGKRSSAESCAKHLKQAIKPQ
jgi:hypothetical protein